MSVSAIHGQLLEVTVVECRKLKDTEWISRQDPYVCLEYGSNKFRTRTCTDGGKNPKFQEKFLFTLIEGLREINVQVWNSNTVSTDDFIGSGKIQLQQVLSRGFCDQFWSLHTKTGRSAGEIKLIMHHQQVNKPAAASYSPSAPPYSTPSQSHVPPYSARPVASAPFYTNPGYPSPSPHTAYPAPTSTYPPPPDPSMYAPPMYQHHAPYPASQYPPSQYPPPPPSAAYPAPPYPPPSAYPPPPYPPPPHASPYGPPGPYRMYPPAPY